MDWIDGEIEGCTLTPLHTYKDDRGWLGEFFRKDELPAPLFPAMGYLSLTHSGVTRGPHEHVHQTDLFLFFSGRFRLFLWDHRSGSPTRGRRWVIEVGEAAPMRVIIPPGVVHAYRNEGETDALVINCPNQLYAGEGKKEAVDEIRHEDLANSPFNMDL